MRRRVPVKGNTSNLRQCVYLLIHRLEHCSGVQERTALTKKYGKKKKDSSPPLFFSSFPMSSNCFVSSEKGKVRGGGGCGVCVCVRSLFLRVFEYTYPVFFSFISSSSAVLV